MSDPRVLLFCYGSLRLPEVQLDTFGRLLTGHDDVLPGYTVDYVDIEDPHAPPVRGQAVHPIIRFTGHGVDKVLGVALEVTEDELEAADEYEAGSYHRLSATLASGRSAWIYVAHVPTEYPA